MICQSDTGGPPANFWMSKKIDGQNGQARCRGLKTLRKSLSERTKNSNWLTPFLLQARLQPKHWKNIQNPDSALFMSYPTDSQHRVLNETMTVSTIENCVFLFVGGLSQRKGIADVFAAADHHQDDVELTVIGRGQVDDCPPLKVALGRHRWIPSMPHDQVLKEMRAHDVLLFPSLFEGFGLVITEAMSQGTPVITTDRTAGPDVFEDGKSGWLVTPGDTDALIRKDWRTIE